ncbi:serine hydrolase domain-containing protein [Thalassotalea sp. 1_MG-2023]|uniref:serine hydrolase domain-containing protein n=1 Tax=Thalassotalea sp. 1_MG-2023 TaxID=3062680 RepID=UPI0026E16F7D|nr:serine hydrolase domain-containing protein [Thalassotalea sp. 1_MG-2023]MDO6426983.1 serine hydrolase domain-containing protein [Thalassotalea sp. 1_MG-2023]
MSKWLFLSVFFFISTSVYAEINKSSAFAEKLNKEIPLILEKSKARGIAISIVDGTKVVGSFYYGDADTDKNLPITQKTIFNVGSISKVVTAWGVMKLVEQGKVSLDEPVNHYLKSWKLSSSSFDVNKVTLRNILSHTSGLSLSGYNGWRVEDPLPTLIESLNGNNTAGGALSIIHEPSTKWSYSGGGYTLVQLLIEDVANQSFNRFITENVLLPLGMTESSFEMGNIPLENLAQPYDENGNKTGMVYFTETAAAGFLTTARDLATFNQAVLKNENGEYIGADVLSNNSIDEMLQVQPHTGGRWSMSYVIDAENNSLGFAGFNRGWTSLTRTIIDKNIGYVILNNSSVGGVNNEIDQLLLSIITEN